MGISEIQCFRTCRQLALGVPVVRLVFRDLSWGPLLWKSLSWLLQATRNIQGCVLCAWWRQIDQHISTYAYQCGERNMKLPVVPMVLLQCAFDSLKES